MAGCMVVAIRGHREHSCRMGSQHAFDRKPALIYRCLKGIVSGACAQNAGAIWCAAEHVAAGAPMGGHHALRVCEASPHGRFHAPSLLVHHGIAHALTDACSSTHAAWPNKKENMGETVLIEHNKRDGRADDVSVVLRGSDDELNDPSVLSV